MSMSMTIPTAITDAAFRRAMSAFATGVAVVTARRADGGISGITVNSFTSVSLEPPLVLWCLGSESERYSHFAEAEIWGVTVLGAEAEALAVRFARAERETAAAAEIEALAGAPVLRGAGVAHLACVTHARHIMGDHLLIVGEVKACRAMAGDGLGFFRGKYGRVRDTGME